MRANGFFIFICSLAIAHAAPVLGQRTGEASSQARSTPVDDPVKALVGRFDLERYKATIKGLTQPVLELLWSGTGGAVRQPRQGGLLLLQADRHGGFRRFPRRNGEGAPISCE